MKKKLLLALIFAVLLPLSVRLITFTWCTRLAGDFYKADTQRYEAMDRGVDYWVNKKMGRQHFDTGSSRFDGEWLFGTYMMATVGKCQTVLQFPEKQEELQPEIEHCLHALMTREVTAFDQEAWSEEPFAFVQNDHAAYLGYYNVALGLYRLMINNSDSSGDPTLLTLNTEISEFLNSRIEYSPLNMLQSYPHEYYSMDNCAVISSIVLYDIAENNPRRASVDVWLQQFRKICVDPESGTLIQAFNARGGIVDSARASGTFLGIYFLSFVDRELAGELYKKAKAEFLRHIFGFAAVKEFCAAESGVIGGDIDSGPVVFGFGLSPIGFMLGCARMFEDEEVFKSLFATCYLGGAPENSRRWNWRSAGPVGDCVLFGMLTSLNNQQWSSACEK